MTETTQPASRDTAKARAEAEANVRRLDHVTQSLEAAQKDLASMGGSLETGMRDLSRDVNRLLRDARRDLTKMRRALQRDLDHLQRNLTAATKPPAKPPAARRATPARRRTATRRRTTAAS